jgi:hypothetical protein
MQMWDETSISAVAENTQYSGGFSQTAFYEAVKYDKTYSDSCWKQKNMQDVLKIARNYSHRLLLAIGWLAAFGLLLKGFQIFAKPMCAKGGVHEVPCASGGWPLRERAMFSASALHVSGIGGFQQESFSKRPKCIHRLCQCSLRLAGAGDP